MQTLAEQWKKRDKEREALLKKKVESSGLSCIIFLFISFDCKSNCLEIITVLN